MSAFGRAWKKGFVLNRKDRLQAFCKQVAEARGLELVDVELFRAGRREVLRAYMHKPGGVTLDDCSQASHHLATLLDADDEFQNPYTLEISSPGLDRPLKTAADWARRVGEWVRVHLSQEVEGRKTWIGRLVRSDSESAVLLPEGQENEIIIPYRAVQMARVDVRFEE
ncbi:MAG: ribosome maturation factor RimP [Fibrobacteria bacterium]|nr:ribosome maturation factor RimP [Fibrobacteria bacterium]